MALDASIKARQTTYRALSRPHLEREAIADICLALEQSSTLFTRHQFRSQGKVHPNMDKLINELDSIKRAVGIGMAMCWILLLIAYLAAIALIAASTLTQQLFHNLFEEPTGILGAGFPLFLFFAMIRFYSKVADSNKRLSDKLIEAAAKSFGSLLVIGIVLLLATIALNFFSAIALEFAQWMQREGIPTGRVILAIVSGIWFALMVTCFLLLIRRNDKNRALEIGWRIVRKSVTEIFEFLFEHISSGRRDNKP